MENLSNLAIDIVNELHTERLNYSSEYLPLIEALSKLAEYEEAENSGAIRKLPCKLGDTLWTNHTMSGWYFRSKDAPYPVKVVFIGLNESEEMGYGFFNVEFEKAGCMMAFDFSNIGKTVFLTKDEALEALNE